MRQNVLNRIRNYVLHNVRDRSDNILRLWADQCEYIIAQRVRRSQQMICHYRRIWEDKALKDLLQRLRKQVQRHARGVLFSSAALLTFDWNKEGITYNSIRDQFNELDYVRHLKLKTTYCPTCAKRIVFDLRVDGIDYCTCSPQSTSPTSGDQTGSAANCSQEGWVPYIERKNMIIWRREEKSGLYAYKVHVSYTDITAADFLHVQTDLDYRRQWDKTAMALDIIESDTVRHTNSQVIYWEMLWPRFFTNRDYVFLRRFFVDRNRRLIVIVNKSTTHPKCPVNTTNQRVNEYWSYMIIKPLTTFTEPGLEFVLTYFDNPGVAIPSTITSWVAQCQLPDYLNKMYVATLNYVDRKSLQSAAASSSNNVLEFEWDGVRDPGYEYPPDPEQQNSEPKDDGSRGRRYGANVGNAEPVAVAVADDHVEPETKMRTSWWNYLHPFYYFA